MTKSKKDKARFWCHTCKCMGYRTEEGARERAGDKPVWTCPSGWGFHYGNVGKK
jgi:hypothetical protein